MFEPALLDEFADFVVDGAIASPGRFVVVSVDEFPVVVRPILGVDHFHPSFCFMAVKTRSATGTQMSYQSSVG
jgi:hypothetical protein